MLFAHLWTTLQVPTNFNNNFNQSHNLMEIHKIPYSQQLNCWITKNPMLWLWVQQTSFPPWHLGADLSQVVISWSVSARRFWVEGGWWQRFFKGPLFGGGQRYGKMIDFFQKKIKVETNDDDIDDAYSGLNTQFTTPAVYNLQDMFVGVVLIISLHSCFQPTRLAFGWSHYVVPASIVWIWKLQSNMASQWHAFPPIATYPQIAFNRNWKLNKRLTKQNTAKQKRLWKVLRWSNI